MVTFSNSSTGASQYTWNFGDGGSSTEMSPDYEYDLGGSYTVQLIAINNDGNRDTSEMNILINTPITFEKRFGNSNNQIGYSVVSTADGGYALVGIDYGGGDLDGYFLRIDSMGNTVFGFPKVIPATGSTYRFNDVQQTTDGGFIIAGTSDSKALLVRTDLAGNIVGSFPKEYTDTKDTPLADVVGEGVYQLPDGGFGIFGRSGNYRGGSGQGDFVYYRTNPSGGQTNFSYYTFSTSWSDEDIGGWIFDGVSEFFAVGSTSIGGSSGQDFCVMKFGIDGNPVSGFPKVYGSEEYDHLTDVCMDPAGGYVASGQTYQLGASDTDLYFVKINASGEPILSSQKTFGGNSDDQGGAVLPTEDGGFIIVGATTSFGQGGSDMYIIKVNNNGNTSFTTTKGGFDTDYATDVLVTKDRGYLIIGASTKPDNSDLDVYVVKTDAKGRVF
jgi:PKD repeat protein